MTIAIAEPVRKGDDFLFWTMVGFGYLSMLLRPGHGRLPPSPVANMKPQGPGRRPPPGLALSAHPGGGPGAGRGLCCRLRVRPGLPLAWLHAGVEIQSLSPALGAGWVMTIDGKILQSRSARTAGGPSMPEKVPTDTTTPVIGFALVEDRMAPLHPRL